MFHRTALLGALTAAAITGTGTGAYFHAEYKRQAALVTQYEARILVFDQAADRMTNACQMFESATAPVRLEGTDVAKTEVANAAPQVPQTPAPGTE
jgi:hypothetical protein